MKEFEIYFVSDVNRESLLVEVSYKKQRLFQINKENVNEDIEIEFLSDLFLENDSEMKFSLNDFEEILKKAKFSLTNETK